MLTLNLCNRNLCTRTPCICREYTGKLRGCLWHEGCSQCHGDCNRCLFILRRCPELGKGWPSSRTMQLCPVRNIWTKDRLLLWKTGCQDCGKGCHATAGGFKLISLADTCKGGVAPLSELSPAGRARKGYPVTSFLCKKGMQRIPLSLHALSSRII